MAGEVILSLEQVSKRYGAYQALDFVSLSLNRGERLVLHGPSGSGKSTLVRTINGLEGIDAGEITVAGHRLSRRPEDVAAVRAEIGMVFQSFNLFPHLTVLENCALPLRLVRGLDRRAAEARARVYLADVHVADQAEKHPAALSGGQQQRVAIARALALEPTLMLFDEPTSALDPAMTREVLDVLLRLADAGTTMVLVTHEMDFAKAFATRMVRMEAGRLDP